MEKIVTAIQTLIAAAEAVKAVNTVNQHTHLQNLQTMANDLIDSLSADVKRAFDTGKGALNNEEIVYLNRNDKINAIKSLRTRTGWGLKEAKDAVEDFIYKHMEYRSMFYDNKGGYFLK